MMLSTGATCTVQLFNLSCSREMGNSEMRSVMRPFTSTKGSSLALVTYFRLH